MFNSTSKSLHSWTGAAPPSSDLSADTNLRTADVVLRTEPRRCLPGWRDRARGPAASWSPPVQQGRAEAGWGWRLGSECCPGRRYTGCRWGPPPGRRGLWVERHGRSLRLLIKTKPEQIMFLFIKKTSITNLILGSTYFLFLWNTKAHRAVSSYEDPMVGLRRLSVWLRTLIFGAS